MRTLLADGNFKQDHLAMKNDHDDVSLSDGCQFMVGRAQFAEYIASAPSLSAAVSFSSSFVHFIADSMAAVNLP